MSRRDTDIHYDDEVGVGDSFFRADRGLHVSADGTRVVGGLSNVRPQKKRRRGAEDLPDVYADWTPVPDDELGDVGGVADTVTSFDMSPDDDSENGKRKQYLSSVGFQFDLTLPLLVARFFLFRFCDSDVLLRRMTPCGCGARSRKIS
jgi:hypothetical protein